MKLLPALITFASAAMLSLPAAAAPADDALTASLDQYQSLQVRGQWLNPLMPHGTGQYAATSQPSGDLLLQEVVAGYGRSLLDRGGWLNPYVNEAHYSAGEPLLAVGIGEGLTTRIAARPPALEPSGVLALLRE